MTQSRVVNLPVVTSKTPEPLTSPNAVHPHKISQRNATIILESATIIPSQTPTIPSVNNNNNNVTTTKQNNKTSKKSPLPSPHNTSKTTSGTNKNSHVNLKNLKNLSSKIATIVPPDDGKALLKQQLAHSNKGVEALGTLVQYLVYHVSNFFNFSLFLSSYFPLKIIKYAQKTKNVNSFKFSSNF